MRMIQSKLMAAVPEILIDDDDDTTSCSNVRIHHWLETGKAPCTYGMVLAKTNNSSNISKQTLKRTFFIHKDGAKSVSDEILSPVKRKTSPKEEPLLNNEPKIIKKPEVNAAIPTLNNTIDIEQTSYSENVVTPFTEVITQVKKAKTESTSPKKSKLKNLKVIPKRPLSPKKVDVSPIVHKRLVTSPTGRRKRRPFSPPNNFSPAKFLLTELQSDRITRSRVPILRSSLKQADSQPVTPEKPSLKPKKLCFMSPVKAVCAFAEVHTNINDASNKKNKVVNKTARKQASSDKSVKKQHKINNCKLNLGDTGSRVESSDISGLTESYILSTRIEKSKTDAKIKAHEILSRSKNVKSLIANNVKSNSKKFVNNRTNDKQSSSGDEIFSLKQNTHKRLTKDNKCKKNNTSNKQVKLIKTQEVTQKPIMFSKVKSTHKKVASLLTDSDDEKIKPKKFFI